MKKHRTGIEAMLEKYAAYERHLAELTDPIANRALGAIRASADAGSPAALFEAAAVETRAAEIDAAVRAGISEVDLEWIRGLVGSVLRARRTPRSSPFVAVTTEAELRSIYGDEAVDVVIARESELATLRRRR